MEVSGGSGGAGIMAMKKAEDVQEQTVSRILNDSAQQLQEQRQTQEDTQKTSSAALTGLGTGLDVTA